MAWPISVDVALKEWATTIAAMESGQQILLLRKGGILEQSQKNQFAITHSEFLFFPTYLHQSRGQLKAEVTDGFEPATAEPSTVRISSAGVVSDIFKIDSREQIDRLDDEHIWTSALIDMRFNYKPINPLYLVLVRSYRLREPIAVENTPEFAGCKSWVPLHPAIATGNALPVLDDLKYDLRRKKTLEKMRINS